MVILMHLLEKLRILDFSLPDKVNFKFIESAKKKKKETQEASANPQE